MKIFIVLFLFSISLTGFSQEKKNLSVDISLGLNQTTSINQGESVTIHLYLDQDIENPYFFNRFKNKKILRSLFVVKNFIYDSPRHFIGEAIASEGLKLQEEERSLSPNYEVLFKNVDFSITVDPETNQVRQYSIYNQIWSQANKTSFVLIFVFIFFLLVILGVYLFLIKPSRDRKKRAIERFSSRINKWKDLITQIPNKSALELIYLDRRVIKENLLRGEEELRSLCNEINQLQYQKDWNQIDSEIINKKAQKFKSVVEFKAYD